MTGSNGSIRQAAALIIHRERVCLVTASSGRRWIIPKGTLEPGQTAEQCAAIEAWEEAGIRGRVRGRMMTRYEATKYGQRCRVSVYRLEVKRIADDWPECHCRRRRWVSFTQAISIVDVPQIRELLRELRTKKVKASKLTVSH
jgi:8-oxo-dGTP pyrophosphatase MutT (NUDIX family)